jgi:hypothetical protein
VKPSSVPSTGKGPRRGPARVAFKVQAHCQWQFKSTLAASTTTSTIASRFKHSSNPQLAKYILVGLELPPSQRSPRQGREAELSPLHWHGAQKPERPCSGHGGTFKFHWQPSKLGWKQLQTYQPAAEDVFSIATSSCGLELCFTAAPIVGSESTVRVTVPLAFILDK